MFDMLSSLGVLPGAVVADLFAGSGAMGIEALSRGARSAVFVDSGREAVSCVERNLSLFGWSRPGAPRKRAGLPDSPGGSADLPDSLGGCSADLPAAGRPAGEPEWTATVVQGDAVRWAGTGNTVDVAFCDPPYAYEAWRQLLGTLQATLIVAESDREIGPPNLAELLKVRRYGTTVVTLIQRDRVGGTREAS